MGDGGQGRRDGSGGSGRGKKGTGKGKRGEEGRWVVERLCLLLNPANTTPIKDLYMYLVVVSVLS